MARWRTEFMYMWPPVPTITLSISERIYGDIRVRADMFCEPQNCKRRKQVFIPTHPSLKIHALTV